MSVYPKNESVSGKWIKGVDVTSGTKCKLVSEVRPVQSQFKDEDGNPKFQDVGKIVFQGDQETYNISLNRTTLNGLIDAFGQNSEEWIDKPLIAETETTRIGGKKVNPVYLIPEGYERMDDEMGFMHVTKKLKKHGTKTEEIETEEYKESMPF